MRVLQAMGGGRHGGAETFFTRLVLALHRDGLEQRVLIRRDADRAATLRAGGLTPVELRFGGRLDPLTPWRIRAEIRRFRPDLVLSWMSRAAWRMPAGRFIHVARLGGYYDLKYFRGCDHLIALTPGIRDHILAGGWPAARLDYLPNFADAAPGRAIDRARHDTPARAPLLLALGRLHSNKAFDTLLAALARLDGAFLWLAGAGPEEQALKRLAGDLGVADRVRFLGWRTDGADLLATADLLVCPSRREPHGTVVIEAWAQDRPIVAAASDGPRFLIRDGVDGLLCPVDDAGALADAIRLVLADPGLRRRLAVAGRESFERRFTEAGVVRAYRALFERLLAA